MTWYKRVEYVDHSRVVELSRLHVDHVLDVRSRTFSASPCSPPRTTQNCEHRTGQKGHDRGSWVCSTQAHPSEAAIRTTTWASLRNGWLSHLVWYYVVTRSGWQARCLRVGYYMPCDTYRFADRAQHGSASRRDRTAQPLRAASAHDCVPRERVSIGHVPNSMRLPHCVRPSRQATARRPESTVHWLAPPG